jgi:dienelactone hydrolase
MDLGRPAGLGLSFPKPDRCVSDFTDEIEFLLDHLDVDRFVALGWSMGGPYAAACAARLSERVRRSHRRQTKRAGTALRSPARPRTSCRARRTRS